jgi:hypothetical protein
MAYTTIGGKLVKVKKNAMGDRYLSQPYTLPRRAGDLTEVALLKEAADKGKYGGSCNITRCQRPNSATWYNHSTRKYYCRGCACELNYDRFNHRDAMEMWGHFLCTEGEYDPNFDYQAAHEAKFGKQQESI